MKAIPGSLIYQILSDGSIFGGDYDGRLGPLTDWMNMNAKLFRGKTILDLGSNAGHFPIEYIRHGAQKVIAVEGRPEFWDQWKQFSRSIPLDLSSVEWWMADVRDFQPLVKADVVSCLGLLYHVEGFLPRLRELSEYADVVLIEVQVTAGENKKRTEKPENRTMALEEQTVFDASPLLWERMILLRFADDFKCTRIWTLCYGDVVTVKMGETLSPQADLTMRSFYVLYRKTADVDFMINSKTGSLNVADERYGPGKEDIKRMTFHVKHEDR